MRSWNDTVSLWHKCDDNEKRLIELTLMLEIRDLLQNPPATQQTTEYKSNVSGAQN